ncbi:NUDIX hydrolase [Thalassoporum mexicanum PCC 7367]|uniref:NUDIX hydrolase n=1 Tax=Thalassoporum mexicanum TaxID=3457544 RepID=UPI00029F8406|nr:NUDIX hydrolase [Pseudanabaena sp. PCC 7367]AFY68802.1 NUDIX hydrolase [Pseudanabaena sp. PCC 7367]
MDQIWRIAKTVVSLLFRRPLAGVSIIPLLADGRIVLIKRRDCGKWGFPGGLVDWGEDISTTAKRELREEAGLELKNIVRLVGVYSSLDRDPRMHSICITVAAEVGGEMKIYDTAEVIEVKAFTLETLPAGQLAHDHDRHLQNYLDNHTALA